MHIRIVLEWFLNPDHLPFLYGIHKGIFEQNGFEVKMIEPEDHYDGFEDIQKGHAEMAITEPLHLVEHHQEGLLSLGCFFETHGGILIRKESLDKLTQPGPFTITTPAANPFTDKLAHELLKGYLESNQQELQADVIIHQTDFYHIQHLKDGYDAAWLCFENFESVEAELEGLDVVMVGTSALKLPNVSALELITSNAYYQDNKEICVRFIDTLNAILTKLPHNLEEAKAIYYEASKEEKSELMDKIIERTLEKFQAITPGYEKWQGLYEWIRSLDLSTLEPEQYKLMFRLR